MARLFLLFAISSLLIGSACSQSPTAIQVGSEEFEELISKGNGVLLDVRTEREFQNGHIENSGQLNFYALDFRQRLLLLPKDQPVYLYCNTGWRSNIAASFLIRNGYTQVYNLEHGIMDWEQADFPVIVDPDAQPDTEDMFLTSEFNALIQQDELVFIDFYAPWCGPCRQMMPMIDSLTTEYKGRVNIVKINADASKRLMRDMKLISVPYLVLYHKGEIIFEHTGLIQQKELMAMLDSYYHEWKNNNN